MPYVNIEYKLEDTSFNITGDYLDEREKYEILENFIRGQVATTEDDREPEKRDFYTIRIVQITEDNSFEVTYDTGSKSLRDSILRDVLGRLEKSKG